MLTEKRLNIILEMLNSKGSVTNAELMEALDASESTVRRDLSTLESRNKIKKVRGGAVKIGYNKIITNDDDIISRRDVKVNEKALIGKYASTLINKDDFVFIDAGTTTLKLVENIIDSEAVFVTNGVEHAKILSKNGIKVHLLGGEYKILTDATVGEEAIDFLDQYNFTKGFFGSNGFHINNGHTTPEVKEAYVKKKALKKCKESYILMDNSKFGIISLISFDKGTESTIITNKGVANKYKQITCIVEV